MAEQPQPKRNPVVEALFGLLLGAGVLLVELGALLTFAAIFQGSTNAVFWVFLGVGLIYFGFLFWITVKQGRKAMLPGLIVAAALWGLLSSACYQLVYNGFS